MKIIKGNLWDSKDELILVTANSCITKDGRLVMGKGATLELKNKYPSIDREFGYLVNKHSEKTTLGLRYGVLLADVFNWSSSGGWAGIFQVKYHFKERADLLLIKYSCEKLVLELESHKINSVSMNFPAIGCGQRTIEEVLPIVSVLPDTVSLYIKE